MPEYTVSAWMERILELTREYEPAVVFSKALPEKGLAEKESQAGGDEKSKTRLTIPFLVYLDGEKVIEPLVYEEVLNPIALKTLKIMSIPMVFTITLTKNHEW